MKTIYQKILNVRNSIKSTTIKKQGHNSFSNYDYFTPEQIDLITFNECKKEGLLNKYDLKRTPLGLIAQMAVIEIETGESEIFELAMEIPEIKATNISQQLGGAMTYSKRYLLMNIYDISDNTLDFDNDKPEEKEQKQDVNWLTKEQFEKAINSDAKGIQATLTFFSTGNNKMKKEYKEQLTAKLNTLK